MWKEAAISVNGVRLTDAQSMTLRVAMEDFAMSLKRDGLGDDDHGKAMVTGYLGAIDGIRRALYGEVHGQDR